MLVEHKVNLNILENLKYYSVLELCENNSLTLDIIKIFFKENRNLFFDLKVQGNSPLHILTINNNPQKFEMFKYLIEGGLQINLKNENGITPLHNICLNESFSFEQLNYMIEKNSEINLKSNQGEIALHFLCRNQNCTYEAIKLLIEKNSLINIQNNQNGDTPLHLLCKNQNVSVEMVKCFVENLADLNFESCYIKSPLQDACCNSNFDVVKFLIEYNSNTPLEPKNNGKKTPLYLSLFNEDISTLMIQYLIEKKMVFNLEHMKDKNLNSPLHSLCKSKNICFQMIKYLVENKCDLNEKNEFGENSFHLACFNDKITIETVKSMIEIKADINAKNFKGHVPFIFIKNKEMREELSKEYFPNKKINF